MTIDKELLVRLKNADESAFQQIFNLYIQKVYQFVFRYIKVRTEAEDVTQNVFLKIWENKSLIDTDKSFEGLLFTIAYRSVIDYFRIKDRTFRTAFLNEWESKAIISHINSDDLLNQHQFDSLYQKALASLPEKRKEIFILRNWSTTYS